MNKPNDYSPSIGPTKKSGDTPQPAKTAPRQDPKETAQEAVHQVTPRDKADTKTPLHAARGNDEVMSQPPSKRP